MIETATLVNELWGLLEAVARGDRPARELVERRLTDGYAHALLLEAERLRLVDGLRTLTRGGARQPRARKELARLTVELAGAEEELAALRDLLATVKAQALR